jgi:hypothetical protein
VFSSSITNITSPPPLGGFSTGEVVPISSSTLGTGRWIVTVQVVAGASASW